MGKLAALFMSKCYLQRRVHRAARCGKLYLGMILLALAVTKAYPVEMQYTVELGGGYQFYDNQADYSYSSLGWHSGYVATLGSHINVGLDDGPFYYSLLVRLGWMGDIINNEGMLMTELGVGGIGFYLTEPLNLYPDESAMDFWYATIDINLLDVRFNINMLPDAQGDFMALQVLFPIHIQAFYMLTGYEGVGLYVEITPLMDIPLYEGYQITGGLETTIGFSAVFR